MLDCNISLKGEWEHLLQTPIRHDDFIGPQTALKQLKLAIHVSLGKLDCMEIWNTSLHTTGSNPTLADFRHCESTP